ncbi:MAG: 2-C-methyl-D-erythritol 4-phosphate cytidylyltransferase [Coriobacteriales bacterium]|jgi:2-C-methyl-D-erythritol 4-phosphate cytidylyltransferase|nr:2-C-methyl-D-erythritol 4-phosphate cytidylyltransferase [Coriobacteriales bacterium]
MDEIGAILLSGGIGSRAGIAMPKQFYLLGGKPIIVHSLEKLESIPAVTKAIIPSPAEWIDKTQEILDGWSFDSRFSCISGGATRQESVLIALQALSKAGYKQVIIHEAVRPFVSSDDFIQLLENENANAMYGIEIPFTVVRGEDALEGILIRDKLTNVQLPQIFDYDLICKAHIWAKEHGRHYTEDASLLYDFDDSLKISIIKGRDENIKITYPLDLEFAELIYEKKIRGGI